MKIGIDAHAAERDGSGNCTYIRNLLKSLLQIDDKNEYVFYTIYPHHPFYQAFKTHKQVQIKHPPLKAFHHPLLRIPLWMAYETLKDRLDILHVQYIAPPFHKGRRITTIHDLGFLHIPETFSRWEVWRSRILVRLTAQKSHKIITGSRFSKQDILSKYHIPPEKIEVVHLGASLGLRPELKDSEIQKTLQKHRIQKPYLLCVGRLNPRKNWVTLVKAFSQLKKKTRIPQKLVIVGKKDFDTREVLRSVHKTPDSREVRFTGWVPDQDLWILYKQADIFIYPSLFEGFGLPVLEAMSLGIPVITSHSSSLREIAGDAALLVDPTDPQALSQAVSKLIHSQELRKNYSEKGIIQAKKFSWISTARQTLKIYEKAVNGEW